MAKRATEQSRDKAIEQSGVDVSEKEESERERQLHGLSVLSLFLHSTATVQEMMSTLLEHAPTVTSSILVYPLLLDRKRQLLSGSILEGCTDSMLENAMDAFQEDLTALEFSILENEALDKLLEEGEVSIHDGLQILMDGVLPDEQWKAAEEQLNVRKVAIVPMVVDNEPLGMVVLVYDHEEINVEVLELLVGHLTLALRDLLVRDDVVRFSDTDPLTWIPNGRYLQRALEAEIARSGRYGRGLALVALDIDNFGDFNANYGQSLGDRLLRTIATTLAEAIAPPELVARLKDDEFVVLLPETNRATAVTITTRLLSSLAQVSAFKEEGAPSVTLSVAIACFPEDADTPKGLLKRVLSDLEETKPEGAGGDLLAVSA